MTVCPGCYLPGAASGCRRLPHMRAWQCKTYKKRISDLVIAGGRRAEWRK